MLRFKMTILANSTIEDSLWNYLQDDMADLEHEVQYVIKEFICNTVYQRVPYDLIDLEVELEFDKPTSPSPPVP